ncbi:MAG: SUMF1/EgtB/PvdO family nonheme iron enzyme [Polyangiaceae bacterium]|nr:SUMF1/EgtB/PvdO family nonheme iron enzyme [Polyangiaceae bacterium]
MSQLSAEKIVAVSIQSVLAAALLFACGNKPKAQTGPEGDLVQIEDGEVTVGFSGMKLEKTQKLPAFRISKTPITQGDVDRCVKAKGCKAFAQCGGELEDRSSAPNSVETCATYEAAVSYCRWLGGRLPTLPEWLSAARGPEVQRFAWGKSAPDCSRHALAVRGSKSDESTPLSVPLPAPDPFFSPQVEAASNTSLEAVTYCAEDPAARRKVGQHPAGASSRGLQDVLLVGSELVATSIDSPFGACYAKEGACLVFGGIAGSIDGAERLPSLVDAEKRPNIRPFSFRCVFPGAAL